VAVRAPVEGRAREVLTPDAVSFVAGLHRKFNATRVELLNARDERQARIAAGEMPDFLPERRAVREGDWRIAPVPRDLQDRRVEITGPVDRKMYLD
jgi:malate synthase